MQKKQYMKIATWKEAQLNKETAIRLMSLELTKEAWRLKGRYRTRRGSDQERPSCSFNCLLYLKNNEKAFTGFKQERNILGLNF